jgi:methylenetetrahydrofolate dehydrogenase (NADP+)/methenyltetrahydrofolate cyclohydrolase
MTATIIDGKEIQKKILTEVKREIEEGAIQAHLAVLLIGSDPASWIYVRNKTRACQEVGIEASVINLPTSASQDEILEIVQSLANDTNIHGILVQLPLPPQINKFPIFDAIPYQKDVDTFTPINVGKLVQNRPLLKPCTPQAVIETLKHASISVKGKDVVIINRSLVVGLPLATMLLQDDEFANATVTVCHEYTRNIGNICFNAEIIVSAVGKRKEFEITGNMVSPGATVIDVGITRLDGKICGDVDFDSVKEKANYITKVPGGIGPVTVACLIRNTLEAYKHGRNK